jgi:hypothetical protein
MYRVMLNYQRGDSPHWEPKSLACLVISIGFILSLFGGCQWGAPVLSEAKVEETKPADKDVGVPVSSDIVVTFSNPMTITATEEALSISPHVDYIIVLSDDNAIATLAPTRPPDYGTTLEEPYTFSFQTEEMTRNPVVMSTDPANLERNVASYQDVRIWWSKPMNKEATTQAIIVEPKTDYEIFWEEEGRLMIIHPLSPGFQPSFGGEGCKITLTTEAMSEDGFYMAEDYDFTFIVAGCCMFR